jgi:hypothetical protein
MTLLTSAALQGYRDFTKRRVSYARYLIDSTWHKTRIESVETLSNGIVEISFMIELESGSGTVTQVQLYDTDNQLWLSKNESLKMSDVSEGYLYVVQLNIQEVSS